MFTVDGDELLVAETEEEVYERLGMQWIPPTLREDRGWLKMDVRWVVTDKNQDTEMTVIGRTILPPGVGSMHALHRHPNAEEWEYCVHGTGIKHVGDESFYIRAGDIELRLAESETSTLRRWPRDTSTAGRPFPSATRTLT